MCSVDSGAFSKTGIERECVSVAASSDGEGDGPSLACCVDAGGESVRSELCLCDSVSWFVGWLELPDSFSPASLVATEGSEAVVLVVVLLPAYDPSSKLTPGTLAAQLPKDPEGLLVSVELEFSPGFEGADANKSSPEKEKDGLELSGTMGE